jgi:chaperonin GroES
MKIKPLGDKIIVQRLAAEEKTASGLYLPEGAKEKPQQAKVVRVGTGKTTDDGVKVDFQVKEGDTILLGKWGGTEIKVDGEDYIVMGEDEVLAIVE